MGKGTAILVAIAVVAGLLLLGMLGPEKEKTGRERATRAEAKA